MLYFATPIIHIPGSGPIPTVADFATRLKDLPGWGAKPWTPWPSLSHAGSTATTSTILPSSVVPAGDFEQMSDEDALGRVQANLLGSVEVLRMVSERATRRRKSSLQRDFEMNQAKLLMDKAKSLYEEEARETQRLKSQHQILLEDYKKLALHSKSLEESLGLSEEKALNQTSQIEELTASVSSKDVTIAELEKSLAEQKLELDDLKGKFDELESCNEGTEKENEMLKDQLRIESQNATDRQTDLDWLLQRGIPGILKSFLTSEEFLARNTALQEESVRLGQNQGCLDTHQAYAELLEGKKLVYDHPRAEKTITDLIADLLNPSYDLIQSFEKGAVDLNGLRDYIAGLPTSPEDVGESSGQPK